MIWTKNKIKFLQKLQWKYAKLQGLKSEFFFTGIKNKKAQNYKN